MPVVRRALLICAAVLGMVSLTSCSVPTGAVTGITIAPDGTPQVAVAVCKGRIDGGVLYENTEPSTAQPSTGHPRTRHPTTGWQHQGAIKDFASWPLAGSAEWPLNGGPLSLLPGRTYRVYATTHDNEWSGLIVEFTVDDLAALPVDHVRYTPWATPGTTVVTSMAEFRAHACDKREKS